MASDITFHYFHGRGIGEPIRLLFTVGEIAFTDRRYSVDEFANMAALKAQLPFGQMPALEVDGVFLGQTDSIARLAARLAGLYPSDPIEAARSDMIVVHQAEMQSALAKMSFDGVPGTPGMKMVPQEERGFVGKVIVQRPAGHACPPDKLSRRGAGIAHVGKQCLTHVKQGAPGPAGAVSFRESGRHALRLPRRSGRPALVVRPGTTGLSRTCEAPPLPTPSPSFAERLVWRGSSGRQRLGEGPL